MCVQGVRGIQIQRHGQSVVYLREREQDEWMQSCCTGQNLHQGNELLLPGAKGELLHIGLGYLLFPWSVYKIVLCPFLKG